MARQDDRGTILWTDKNEPFLDCRFLLPDII